MILETNSYTIEGFRQRNIIANPNCSTIQMGAALKPLNDIARIRRVVVATYQSVSGAGQKGMNELYNQTKSVYQLEEQDPKTFPVPIAFNIIPHIGDFLPNGFTQEEQKMIDETKKILSPEIEVVATCARVPVFVSHSESITVEFDEPIDVDQALEEDYL